MDEDPAWDDLIGEVYLSATDGGARQRLPGALSRFFHGSIASVWAVDGTSGEPVSEMVTNLPAEADRLYRAYYHRHDPWMHRARHAWVDKIVRGFQLIDDTALLRTEFYNDFGHRIDAFHAVGSYFSLGSAPDLPLGVVSVLRPQGQEGFEDRDAARVRQLVPHLRRAWRIGQQVTTQAPPSPEAGMAAVVQGLRAAAIVTDGGARVRLLNAAAERLDAAGALRLRAAPPDRALALPGEAETQGLHRAIAQAVRGGVGMETLMELGGAGACHVTVSPLPAGEAGRWALVLITLQSLTPDEATLARAQRLFGFTRTEAEVALSLADGRSPAEIAEERQVRISTIRTQLLQAQEKAGTADLRGLAIRVTLLRD